MFELNERIDNLINSWPETNEVFKYQYENCDIQLAYDRIVPFGSNIVLHYIMNHRKENRPFPKTQSYKFLPTT